MAERSRTNERPDDHGSVTREQRLSSDSETRDVSMASESQGAYYSAQWPTVFERAAGPYVFDEDGRRYLDFFCSAGSMNYGHNEPVVVEPMIRYLGAGGVMNSQDAQTTVRRRFISTFVDHILSPRNLNYRLQLTNPAGSDCVEAALRLARKVTGRTRIASLNGAFHGETLGAIALSHRAVEGAPLGHETIRLPHEMDQGGSEWSIQALSRAFTTGPPLAALIIETVQGEGGCRPLSRKYLARARQLCDEHGSILIVDDIQAGCGRTGTFFSFENSGVCPDLVCLSKSLSGSGLPLALLLVKPEHDVWTRGEFSGTFRGNNLAFVSATATILAWWSDDKLHREMTQKSIVLRDGLESIARRRGGSRGTVTGRGLLLGLQTASREQAQVVAREAFRLGLLIETCGPAGDVLKIMPPLTISDEDLDAGVEILDSACSILDFDLSPPRDPTGWVSTGNEGTKP